MLFFHKLNTKLSSRPGVNCIPNLTSLQLAVFSSNPRLLSDKYYPHTEHKNHVKSAENF